ncbi:DUF7530 family protein [Natrinema salsiterrestre]|uniref:DUF7530 family protein n=1 Tax=Natrinema salsiterrestre TaxID=2950540 RepID=UPI003CE4EE5A
MTRTYQRIAAIDIGIAAVQLPLSPLVTGHPVLFVALGGHAVAVLVVATLSIVLQERRWKKSIPVDHR